VSVRQRRPKFVCSPRQLNFVNGCMQRVHTETVLLRVRSSEQQKGARAGWCFSLFHQRRELGPPASSTGALVAARQPPSKQSRQDQLATASKAARNGRSKQTPPGLPPGRRSHPSIQPSSHPASQPATAPSTSPAAPPAAAPPRGPPAWRRPQARPPAWWRSCAARGA